MERTTLNVLFSLLILFVASEATVVDNYDLKVIGRNFTLGEPLSTFNRGLWFLSQGNGRPVIPLGTCGTVHNASQFSKNFVVTENCTLRVTGIAYGTHAFDRYVYKTKSNATDYSLFTVSVCKGGWGYISLENGVPKCEHVDADAPLVQKVEEKYGCTFINCTFYRNYTVSAFICDRLELGDAFKIYVIFSIVVVIILLAINVFLCIKNATLSSVAVTVDVQSRNYVGDQGSDISFHGECDTDKL